MNQKRRTLKRAALLNIILYFLVWFGIGIP